MKIFFQAEESGILIGIYFGLHLHGIRTGEVNNLNYTRILLLKIHFLNVFIYIIE
jgi:hypothetical protein